VKPPFEQREKGYPQTKASDRLTCTDIDHGRDCRDIKKNGKIAPYNEGVDGNGRYGGEVPVGHPGGEYGSC
jgi:hypothetical protein